MKHRKTEDIYEIQGNYGFGYEAVTAETEWREARARLREYRENEPGTFFRIARKRIKLPVYTLYVAERGGTNRLGIEQGPMAQCLDTLARFANTEPHIYAASIEAVA